MYVFLFFPQDVESELLDSKKELSDLILDGNRFLLRQIKFEAFYNDFYKVIDDHQKLVSGVPEIERELNQLASELNEINASIESTYKKLTTLEDEIDALKAVGSDTTAINSQMEQLKVFFFYMSMSTLID